MAPSNQRLGLKIHKLLGAHNAACISERGGKGIMLIFDGWCITHIMGNVLKRCFHKNQLLAKLHAVAFAGSNINFFLRLM